MARTFALRDGGGGGDGGGGEGQRRMVRNSVPSLISEPANTFALFRYIYVGETRNLQTYLAYNQFR